MVIMMGVLGGRNPSMNATFSCKNSVQTSNHDDCDDVDDLMPDLGLAGVQAKCPTDAVSDLQHPVLAK